MSRREAMKVQSPFEQSETGSSLDAAAALLQELEVNTSDAIRRLRADERVAIKSKIVIRSGNAGDLQQPEIQGVTGDVSGSGCLVLSPIPLLVGTIYRLSFDRSVLDLPMVFARCLRCRLIREEAFECGFAFFSRLELPSAVEPRPAASSIVA